MVQEKDSQAESDGLSGPWVGYYTYDFDQRKHRMELILNFKEKQITGGGLDDIAQFIIVNLKMILRQ